MDRMIGRAALAAALVTCSAATMLATAAPVGAQGIGRLEVHPIPSVTVTNQQFLTGNLYGKPVTLAGELRLPRATTEKFPLVVLVHGSGGLGAATDRWAQELNNFGVAAFLLDSFTGRGIVTTSADQSQLDSIAMMHDAFGALARLAAHPRIDASRIAVMGFSKGAVAAVYSSNQRFRKLYGPAGAEFAAHIGLYTPCNIAFRDDALVTGKPIRMHHGIADDYVSIEPCRSYVQRMKQTGADVVLNEYADAHHAYDVFTLPPLQKNATSQTTRNCLLQEGDKGQILNAKTGQPYSLATDSCVELGPHVGYNAAAHQATVKAVKDFLDATFKLGQ
jgi:dienelactone hydrolase